MKKTIAAILFTAVSVLAVGPKMACILTFTPSTSPDASGYWFYWRSLTGTYGDTQRRQIGTNDFSGFDLRVIGLPKGEYMAMMTATNLAGMESDPSVEIPWHYVNPNKPSNLIIKTP